MTPEPAARERDEVFLELTKSICPVCKTTIDAEVNTRDNQVFLRKRCAEHGEFEARVYGDAQMYVDAQRFNKPGTRPLQTQTEVKDGCPRTADCVPNTSSTRAWASSRSTPAATSTARSALPTPDLPGERTGRLQHHP